ncbi:cell wall metabolism sensor histidine kinase WalK [Bacillus sp. AFS040349]|uniref:sensor histidine kinase n=1 Tax=Bacillus sp. AFS040349 TaxID=2033502 RepID=UPI000BFB872A|nr:HAMP domain-containing sensor histidine kinase [Bacillus sp. AFS040349]PGT86460.1 two-component sensor histidine kinase [Bacillus sp. AFS040349]
MKISIKLGLWFFICIFIIEASSMFFLHRNVVHSLVNEELDSLKSRGNSHSDVLDISYDESTLHHIQIMETGTDTEVVITDEVGKIMISSKPIDDGMGKILTRNSVDLDAPNEGLILQADWQNEQYISTVSSFKGPKGDIGYVYMFKSTDQIQRFISRLNEHFILASVLILFFMLITIFFLSKALTKPLISMKEATRKISKGDFSVSLPKTTNDEIGELSTSIQKLANDLNYLKKERTEFLASISHELRTPLTYIKGYTDIARRENLSEKDRLSYLNIIYEEANHVGDLLKELFDLAKMDQNTFTISKEKVKIGSFMYSIFQKMKPAFDSKGVRLEFVCKINAVVDIDPIRFEQVLLNLLDNALKYSDTHTLTTIEITNEGNLVKIFVKDQGIGIPAEDLPYIFDRLYRVDKSRSRLTGGYGIGLSIVKEIVDAHGGNITVESQLNKGTCFKITLKGLYDDNSFVNR